jgi:hypothetical protein
MEIVRQQQDPIRLFDDDALARIGEIVHYLDVGGVALPEVAGFAAITTGLRVGDSTDEGFSRT